MLCLCAPFGSALAGGATRLARFRVASALPWRPIRHASAMPLHAARRHTDAGGRLDSRPRLCASVTRCRIAAIRKTRKRVATTAPGRAIRGRSQSLVDSATRLVQGMCARAGDRRRCGPSTAVGATGKGRQVSPRCGRPSAHRLVYLASAMAVHTRLPAETIPGPPTGVSPSRRSRRLDNVAIAGRACQHPVRGR